MGQKDEKPNQRYGKHDPHKEHTLTKESEVSRLRKKYGSHELAFYRGEGCMAHKGKTVGLPFGKLNLNHACPTK